jgi:hypothetical protein
MAGRGALADIRIEALEALAPTEPRAQLAVGEIFGDVGSGDRSGAARKTLSLLTAHPQLIGQVMATARQHVFAKGTDSHDYKFSSAVLEDFYHVAPAWRNRFLASSMFWLKGAAGADSPVLQRTRAALGNG